MWRRQRLRMELADEFDILVEGEMKEK